MSIEQLILLIVSVVLVALVFYVAGGLVSREWSVDGAYAARLVLVALIAVVLMPLFTDVTGRLHLGSIGLLLVFVLLVVLVRFVLVDELTVTDEWLASIVICLVGVVLLYLVNLAADDMLNIRVFSFI